MKEQVANRDGAAEAMEQAAAEIKNNQVGLATTMNEIAKISENIAQLTKALKEARELRMEEKADNEHVIGKAEAGRAAVEQAISILNNFYDNAFLQRQPQSAHGGKWIPLNSDREGKTVADLAPEYADSTYHGKKAESRSIIALLEVILRDFDRTDTTVTKQEQMSQEEFEEFEETTTGEISRLEKELKKKKKQKTDYQDAITEAQDDLNDATDAHKAALGAIDGLTPLCIEGVETYEERVEKREKEIEALKKAHAILENWNS